LCAVTKEAEPGPDDERNESHWRALFAGDGAVFAFRAAPKGSLCLAQSELQLAQKASDRHAEIFQREFCKLWTEAIQDSFVATKCQWHTLFDTKRWTDDVGPAQLRTAFLEVWASRDVTGQARMHMAYIPSGGAARRTNTTGLHSLSSKTLRLGDYLPPLAELTFNQIGMKLKEAGLAAIDCVKFAMDKSWCTKPVDDKHTHTEFSWTQWGKLGCSKQLVKDAREKRAAQK
jgi:hypothetical protein